MTTRQKLSFIFGALTLTGTLAMAQKSTTAAERVSKNSISTNGFRVSFIKPDLEVNVTTDTQGRQDKFDDSIGLALGYAHLPIRELGFTSNLAMFQMKERATNFNLVRLDGNLGTALNRTVSIKGGINVSKFTNGGFQVQQLNPGLGLQASLGLQVIPNFGVDLGYVEMTQQGSQKIDNGLGTQINQDLRTTGLEIALHGTF